MNNVLVYVRPWNYHQFADLARKTWNNSTLEFISEHRGQDTSGFISRFYDNYEKFSSREIQEIKGLSDDQVEDVVVRCRLLRALERPKALRMIKSALFAIEDVFTNFDPDYVISVTVDSYILHLISIVCEKREVKFIGMVPTFINGYFRITTVGEKSISREVFQGEIFDIKRRLLEDQYKPTWLASSRKSINRRAKYSWAKNLIKPLWFSFYSWFKHDPLNAHYLTTKIISGRYWSIFPNKYSGIAELGQLDNICAKEKRRKVFLPLQMSPEATVDYWSADTSWVNYEEKILEVIDGSPDNVVYFVKEHPNVLGFRSPNFYENLFSRGNVIAIDPSLPSNDILGLSDLVLVCTGSVGFESLLRKKAVVSDSNPFYAPECQFLSVDALSKQGARFCGYNEGMDVDDLIGYLLSGCLKGTFLNDGSWSGDNQLHQEYNVEIANSLQHYFSSE